MNRLDVSRYAQRTTERLVATMGTRTIDWRGIVDKGMGAAYEQSDAASLTSMVKVIVHLLDGQGRFEDAIGEIDHALVFARDAADARIILLGLKAAMLAAPGRFQEAREALAAGEAHLSEVEPTNAIRFRIYRKVVLWQALEADDGIETGDLLSCTAEPALHRDRTFLLSWYVPFLATAGDRRAAHPWIRAIRLEAEASNSRWRISDAAAFEAWDDFLREPESRRGRGALEAANAVSVWRGEAVHLREAVLKRDVREADAALESMRQARRRIGSADVGTLEQFTRARQAINEMDRAASAAPPESVNLNNLGGWLAEAETIALQGTQGAAADWFEAFTTVVPAGALSSLEWPASVLRVRGLLALRAGMTRRAKADLQLAIEWSEAVGSSPEHSLALLQMGELCASADLRVPERVWKAQRKDGAARLRSMGYDPVPQAYAVAHSLTLSTRNKLAERLTPREVQVLARLGDGLSYREAGVSMGIAVPTVQTLAHRAYEKLGMSGRVQAVAEAKRLGVL